MSARKVGVDKPEYSELEICKHSISNCQPSTKHRWVQKYNTILKSYEDFTGKVQKDFIFKAALKVNEVDP